MRSSDPLCIACITHSCTKLAQLFAFIHFTANARPGKNAACVHSEGLFVHPKEQILVACLAVALLAGCRPQEQIARYTVPKPELINPVSSSAPAASAAAPQAILGAIIPAGEQSWFFKLSGEPKSVEAVHDAFVEFVKSVKFAGGGSQPSWTLPEGWKEQPGSQFRFATIQLPDMSTGGKPLEIAVSSAGGSVLDNINRWRGQVGLQRIEQGELASTAEQFKVGDAEATLVHLVGTATGSGMGGGPFAAASSGGPAPPPLAQKKAADAGLVYELPREWKPGRLDALSVALFTTEEGEAKCKITITPAGGDLLDNVNRWRTEQVGLPAIKAADLASSVQKIETLGVQGDYVELVGPGDVTESRAILAVMAAVKGQTWFIKLLGDSEIAAREKPRFEAFVKSLKFK